MFRKPEYKKEKWFKKIKKLHNFNSWEIWRVIKKSQISEDRTLLGSKWVFKIKRDNRHRSRLVRLDYTQIPGVDFTDNFSIVIHGITLRIILSLWIIHGLDIDQINIETVFF